MKKDKSTARELPAARRNELLAILSSRFEKNKSRHKGMAWAEVRARLESHPGKLWSLGEMEESGGEPDVIGYDKKSGEFIFCDCSPESPSGRRSLCYDGEALDGRKEHKPKGSAVDSAAEMGIDLLTEEEYGALQELGRFDGKTSSWLLTPAGVRNEGGAIFGDYRYGRVFVYHNGAQSYYAARGFRGKLRV